MRRAFSCLAILPLFTGACAVTSPQEVNKLYHDVLEQRRESYKVTHGDVITIRAYSAQTNLSLQTLTVLPDGRADGFFLHDYRFAGKTIEAIENDVRAAYRDELTVAESEISILVTPRSEQVVMNGHFRSPGPVDYAPGMTLNDAIALAGRLRITADSDYALLRRPHANTPGFPARFRVDLNDESEEIFLLPGDEVYLPPNGMALFIEYLREYIFGVIPSTVYGAALGVSGAGF